MKPAIAALLLAAAAAPASALTQQEQQLGKVVADQFKANGLWTRSVQPNSYQWETCDCEVKDLGSPVLKKLADGGSKRWTYIRPEIPQKLFGMSSDAGTQRAIGILIDWTKTWDRFVDAHPQDMSSNRGFPETAKLGSSEQSVKHALDEMVKLQHSKNDQAKEDWGWNEVRSLQYNPDSFVGFIWFAIDKENPLYAKYKSKAVDAGPFGMQWKDTRHQLELYAKSLHGGPAGKSMCSEKFCKVSRTGFPVFTYVADHRMKTATLELVDVVHAQ